MPITMGTLTCRCFTVSGRPPADFRETYPLQIQRNAYRPPDPERGHMRSIGWVHPVRILDSEFDFDSILFGARMVLGLRIDSISINNRIYKARLFDEMAAHREKTKRPRLTRDEKNSIEEALQIQMAKAQTPASVFHELAWNLKTGEALFTGLSDKLCMEAQELFNETFELSLEPKLPYLRAEAIAGKLGLKAELIACQPADLAPEEDDEAQ